MPLFCIEWAQSFDDCGRPGPPICLRRHTTTAIRRGRREPTTPILAWPAVVPLKAAASRFNKPDAQHSGRLPELSTISVTPDRGTDGTIPDLPKLALKIALVRCNGSEQPPQIRPPASLWQVQPGSSFARLRRAQQHCVNCGSPDACNYNRHDGGQRQAPPQPIPSLE